MINPIYEKLLKIKQRSRWKKSKTTQIIPSRGQQQKKKYFGLEYIYEKEIKQKCLFKKSKEKKTKDKLRKNNNDIELTKQQMKENIDFNINARSMGQEITSLKKQIKDYQLLEQFYLKELQQRRNKEKQLQWRIKVMRDQMQNFHTKGGKFRV